MKTVNPKSKKTTTSRKTSRKKTDSVLSICPVNGAGWCPYPFSPAQLKKRLKKIEDNQQDKQLVTTSN